MNRLKHTVRLLWLQLQHGQLSTDEKVRVSDECSVIQGIIDELEGGAQGREAA